ncbi:P-loop containing nucleoside triphosphate hydrolase protein [Mycena capillaripes]|nr:P-loop containing nucleoside triphosphate hydrolase protein [Mycena capillaripes]
MWSPGADTVGTFPTEVVLTWRNFVVAKIQSRALKILKIQFCSKSISALFLMSPLHPHQVQTGQNTLRGISTFLDAPTGGGKTLAFWYPLFYYWAPGNTDEDCQKIILVVGPLTALLESQAADLTEKGVPAVAISPTSSDPDQLFILCVLHVPPMAAYRSLKNLAQNKYRVALISPKMAISPKFHSTVLSSEVFANNIISLVIDESHCITEWGNDDFRPDFSNLYILVGRIPSGVPVVAASATMPKDVISDIRKKLRLPADCAHIAVSNDKKNIALSVRVIQHPLDTFADLMVLFPHEATGPEDFVQSLIYAEDRTTTKKIQDFLRRNSPDEIAEQAFEFYHRHIDEARKKVIQEGIKNGSLRGVAATDALGMVCVSLLRYRCL